MITFVTPLPFSADAAVYVTFVDRSGYRRFIIVLLAVTTARGCLSQFARDARVAAAAPFILPARLRVRIWFTSCSRVCGSAVCVARLFTRFFCVSFVTAFPCYAFRYTPCSHVLVVRALRICRAFAFAVSNGLPSA